MPQYSGILEEFLDKFVVAILEKKGIEPLTDEVAIKHFREANERYQAAITCAYHADHKFRFAMDEVNRLGETYKTQLTKTKKELFYMRIWVALLTTLIFALMFK